MLIPLGKKRNCRETRSSKQRISLDRVVEGLVHPCRTENGTSQAIGMDCLSYEAEARVLKIRDERKITSMEMWLGHSTKHISWREKELTIAFYNNLI